ncbi:MAG TPA: DUF4097 family beta strand repeat-containing protein [Thermoanaerobaculia bacterium]|nr:DUF4097 family beta strand repeat-containing protein [Thermoanaerobaculia bacterium]
MFPTCSRQTAASLLLALPLLLVSSSATAATLTRSTIESYELPADGSLELSNANGDIIVVVWDRPEVEVETLRKATATSESMAQKVIDGLLSEVELSGGHLRIRTRRPESESWTSWFRPASGSIQYVVSLPSSIAVEARSTNGNVTIEGSERRVQARTTNGNVRLRDVAGEVTASSTNGRVEASLSGALDGASLSTTNGRIRLELAAGFGVDLEARAVNGRVAVDVPIRLSSRDQRGKTIRGELWGGGAPVSLRSVNGSIAVSQSE